VQALPVSWDGYFDLLGVEVAAGTAPDVLQLTSSWPIELGTDGLLDLRQFSELDLSQFPQGVLDASTVNGATLGAPSGGTTQAVVINKDISEQAGVEIPDENTWTWEDFKAVAQQIADNTPDGTYGVEAGPHSFLTSFARQRNGMGITNPDGTLAIDEATLTDFFALIKDLQDSGASASAEISSELAMVGQAESLFGRGLAGMSFIPANLIGAFADASGANLALMRLPGDAEFSHVGSAIDPPQWFSISANTKNPHAAAVLVDWLVNSPVNGAIMGTDRGVPLNQEVANAIYDDQNASGQELFGLIGRVQQNAGRFVPLPPGGGEQQPITIRANEEVLFGRMTPQQAAQQWIRQFQQALDAAR
jgi:multiple sugar transport system substrate-binding protein